MTIDLNAPAFGPGAQKIETKTVETTVQAPQAEPEKVEEPVKPEEPAVAELEEEQKVPYSRFKKFHDRAREAETLAQEARDEADMWKARAEQANRKQPTQETEGEAPTWWRELYGDSDAALKAWNIQDRENTTLRERITQEARQEALDAIKNSAKEEAERIEKNVEAIDAKLEQLEALTGKPLTEKEQSALLDIVDEYTPKDDDGNYLGATIPFEKAWEIYELKAQAQKGPKNSARDRVASLNGSQSSGEASIQSEADKNFNPLDWNAWKKRL